MYLGAKVAWNGILFLLDSEEPNLECDQCVFAACGGSVEPKLEKQIQQNQPR